jgi:hypothetical protein
MSLVYQNLCLIILNIRHFSFDYTRPEWSADFLANFETSSTARASLEPAGTRTKTMFHSVGFDSRTNKV